MARKTKRKAPPKAAKNTAKKRVKNDAEMPTSEAMLFVSDQGLANEADKQLEGPIPELSRTDVEEVPTLECPTIGSQPQGLNQTDEDPNPQIPLIAEQTGLKAIFHGLDAETRRCNPDDQTLDTPTCGTDPPFVGIDQANLSLEGNATEAKVNFANDTNQDIQRVDDVLSATETRRERDQSVCTTFTEVKNVTDNQTEPPAEKV
ncbi:unnamed protein product [Closterium sp. NIES-53]